MASLWSYKEEGNESSINFENSEIVSLYLSLLFPCKLNFFPKNLLRRSNENRLRLIRPSLVPVQRIIYKKLTLTFLSNRNLNDSKLVVGVPLHERRAEQNELAHFKATTTHLLAITYYNSLYLTNKLLPFAYVNSLYYAIAII